MSVEQPAHEAEEARTQLAALAADVAAFEQQYGMSPSEFARRYEAGQTDDRMDFVAWASLVRMRDTLPAARGEFHSPPGAVSAN